MSSLAEIEAAIQRLAHQDNEELLLFLATNLREGRERLPEPRIFSKEEMDGWIAEVEADMQRIREGK